VPAVYVAILARCCFVVGDFANAASYFSDLLKRRVLLEEDLDVEVIPKIRPLIYLHLARNLRAASRPTEAADVLSSALRKHPGERSFLLEQAELAEERGEFVQAFRSLKAATDSDPKRDLGTRLAVGLGEVFVATKEAAAEREAALKDSPELATLIGQLVQIYWPTFSRLGDGARGRWLAGLLHMTYTSRLEPRLRQPLLEDAVVAFAKAVEGELKERVFGPSRIALEGQAQAKARLGNLDRSQPEHRFVLFVIGKEKKLTLGEMQTVLAATRKSQEGLSSEFRAWLMPRVPRWQELVGLLDSIVQARNPAAHGEDGVELSAPQVHGQCQRALDILVGQPR
jgi:tetratricopeptide (TPR) repeat protein